MAIQKPYYAKHQIVTGQYSPGGQYITENGIDYIGGYHILPTGQAFSEFSPKDNSIELFIKKFDISEDVRSYNKIQGIKNVNYIQPSPILVRPTLDDYNDGFIYRFFVQKRNNPLITTIEIDNEQYNSINTQNKPGINGVIWNSYMIKWKITGATIDEHNQREIDKSITAGFIGLKKYYLKNLFEFSK